MTEIKNPVTAVSKELQHINDIKALISDDLDEKLLLDTIEGETNMHELLLLIEEDIAERETMIGTLKKRIETLNIRKQRIESTSKTLRTIILSAMDKAGIKKIEGACATLTAKHTSRGLVIENEQKIPADYFNQPDPVVDKKKLLTALKENKEVSGAYLNNGGITLQIRRT